MTLLPSSLLKLGARRLGGGVVLIMLNIPNLILVLKVRSLDQQPSALPGSLFERQTLAPHSRPTASEFMRFLSDGFTS